MKVVVVTGVSGAGKSTALRALEDLGFYCADNLPMPLLPKFIELLADREEVARAALVVDARSGDFLDDAGPILSAVRAAGHSIEVLFLDAPDDVLSGASPRRGGGTPCRATTSRMALHAERGSLSPLRQEATTVIDTRDLTVHGLRALVLERYGRSEATWRSRCCRSASSTACRWRPTSSSTCAFCPTPSSWTGSPPLSGEDAPVQKFVLENPESQLFLGKAEELLGPVPGGLRARGEVLRHRGGGLYRWAASLGGRWPSSWAAACAHLDGVGAASDVHAPVGRRPGVNSIFFMPTRTILKPNLSWACGRDHHGRAPRPWWRRAVHPGRIPALSAVSPRWGRVHTLVEKISQACEDVDQGAGVLLLVDVHGSTPFTPR
jgi:UPF0042 nucleotide-binding protein